MTVLCKAASVTDMTPKSGFGYLLLPRCPLLPPPAGEVPKAERFSLDIHGTSTCGGKKLYRLITVRASHQREFPAECIQSRACDMQHPFHAIKHPLLYILVPLDGIKDPLLHILDPPMESKIPSFIS
jgi:hypothetical protein